MKRNKGVKMTSDDRVVFENERYVVVVDEFPEAVMRDGATYFRGYVVANRETDVDEFYAPMLPDAIAAAEQLDVAMEQSVWKWIRIQAQAQALDEAEEPGPREVH